MIFKVNFNKDLYMRIRGIRESVGLPIRHEGLIITDYPLLGKKIKCLEDNKTHIVDRAVKMWYHGYFICLIAIDENRSSAALYWENISSIDEIILESIKENHNNWQLLE